jgi:hypothetical protein
MYICMLIIDLFDEINFILYRRVKRFFESKKYGQNKNVEHTNNELPLIIKKCSGKDSICKAGIILSSRCV